MDTKTERLKRESKEHFEKYKTFDSRCSIKKDDLSAFEKELHGLFKKYYYDSVKNKDYYVISVLSFGEVGPFKINWPEEK